MKKRLGKTMALTIITSLLLTNTAYAAEFTDVPNDAWFYSFVKHASDKGWVSGYGNNLFGPNDILTNAQAITIISRAANITPTDANEYWYSGFAETAINNKLVSEDCDWNAPISRLEMAKIIIKAYKINSEQLIEDGTASPFIDVNDKDITALYNYHVISGIITENGLTFKPEKTLTRAELCTMLMRLDTNPYLSEKVKNENFTTNDYTSGYKYFLEKRTEYDKDVSNTKNIVDGLIYMTTNDLYSVEFKYKGSRDKIKEEYDKIFDIWNTLSNAYPEYFSIYHRYGIHAEYSLGSYSIKFYAEPRDHATKEEAIVERALLFRNAKNSVNELFTTGLLNENMTETEKAYIVAKWIVDNAQYDLTYSSQSHYGSDFYVDHNLVCEGYTTLYNTMLKFLNINAYGVLGTSKGGNHMWSINNLDGIWKYTDVTHMDPVNFDKPDKAYFNEEYFNKTESEMLELNDTRTTDIAYLEKIEKYNLQSKNN